MSEEVEMETICCGCGKTEVERCSLERGIELMRIQQRQRFLKGDLIDVCLSHGEVLTDEEIGNALNELAFVFLRPARCKHERI